MEIAAGNPHALTQTAGNHVINGENFIREGADKKALPFYLYSRMERYSLYTKPELYRMILFITRCFSAPSSTTG